MSEFKRRRDVFVLVVGRQPQPEFVAGAQVPGTGNQSNAVSHSLADRHRGERNAGQQGRARFAGRFVDLPQSRAKLSRRDVCSLPRAVHMLQDFVQARFPKL